MTNIKSEVVFTATPGTSIVSFVEEVYTMLGFNTIHSCLLSFNGWWYELNNDFPIPSKKEVIDNFYCYINKDR